MIGVVRPEARYALPTSREEHERLGRLARRGARRESHADHARERVGGVDRVVALREQRLVRRRGDVLSARALLRRPVEPRVRLVPDGEVVDPPLRRGRRDRRRPRAEAVRVVQRALRRVEDEDDVDPGRLRQRRGALEERQLGDDRGVRRIPGERPAVLGEARAGELRVEPRTAVVRVLRGVVGDAPVDRRHGRDGMTRAGASRGGAGRQRDDERDAAACENGSELHPITPFPPAADAR